MNFQDFLNESIVLFLTFMFLLKVNITSSEKKHQFLGAFEKLRKVTISFVMPVRPSAATARLPMDGLSW